MNLDDPLLFVIALLALGVRRRIKELEKRHRVGRIWSSEDRKAHEALSLEFDVLKLRLKAIQGGD